LRLQVLPDAGEIALLEVLHAQVVVQPVLRRKGGRGGEGGEGGRGEMMCVCDVMNA
jgi:hypothetical protein